MTLTIPPIGVPSDAQACDFGETGTHGPTSVASAVDFTHPGRSLALCRACLVGYLGLASQNLTECLAEARNGIPVDAGSFLPYLDQFLTEVAWYTQTLAAWPLASERPTPQA